MTGKNWAGPNAAGAPTRCDDDVALERANLAVVTANTAAAASTDATARATANAAYGIAVAGTNVGIAGTNAASVAQSRADNAFSIAVWGTDRANAAYALAATGTNAVAPFVTYGTNVQTIVIVGTESRHTIQVYKGLIQSWAVTQ